MPLPRQPCRQTPRSSLDETTLKSVSLPTTSPDRLSSSGARPNRSAPEKVSALIWQFDAHAADRLEKACAELIAIGRRRLRAALETARISTRPIRRWRSARSAHRRNWQASPPRRRVLAFRRPANADVGEAFATAATVWRKVETTLMTVSAIGTAEPDAALGQGVGRRPLADSHWYCHAGQLWNREPRCCCKLLNVVPIVVSGRAGEKTCSDVTDAEGRRPDRTPDLPAADGADRGICSTASLGSRAKPVQGKDDAARAQTTQPGKHGDEHDGTRGKGGGRVPRTLTEADRVKGMKLIELLSVMFETGSESGQGMPLGASMLLPPVKMRPQFVAASAVHSIPFRTTILNVALDGARMLAVRKPAGATESIPLEDNPIGPQHGLQRRQTGRGFVKAARRDDRPAAGAAVVAALRRTATDVLPALRKLLKDPDATVRLRRQQGWPNRTLAMPFRPYMSASCRAIRAPGLSAACRRSRSTASHADRRRRSASETSGSCSTWWKANGDKIELVARRTPLSERFLNYTLLVQPKDRHGDQLVPAAN